MPVIPSVPATFTVDHTNPGSGNNESFQLPATTVVSGFWSVSGTMSAGTVFPKTFVSIIPSTGGGGTDTFAPTCGANGAYNATATLGAASLNHINTHLGANVTVNFDLGSGGDVTWSLAVSSWTLTVTLTTGQQIVIPGTVGLFDFCKAGILCLEDMQVLEKLVLQQTISGYTAPFGFQIARSDFAGYLEFLPGFVMINQAAGNLSLGIRVYKGKSAPDNAWHQGVNVQVGNPDAIFGAWYPALIPWNDLLNLYVEFFYPIAASIPANSTLEMTIRPFN